MELAFKWKKSMNKISKINIRDTFFGSKCYEENNSG